MTGVIIASHWLAGPLDVVGATVAALAVGQAVLLASALLGLMAEGQRR